MIRQKLDEYLDDALEPAARAHVEQLLASDPTAATLLERMKVERALRTAAFSQYAPDAGEARSLAASMLAACHAHADAPAGRVGIWIKRSLGVAAAVALVAGAFALGRASAPQAANIAAGNSSAAAYYVLYNDESGEPQMKDFTSLDDAMAFQKQTGHASVELASGSFDAEHPGSF
jgi:anti-sigma factor RsiW